MNELTVYLRPHLSHPRLILGFTGWMDGGRVSTGSITYLREKLGGTKFAEINSLGFYMLNFPVTSLPVTVLTEDAKAVVTSVNPMEFAAVFRPHVKIEGGLIKEFTYQRNEFFAIAGGNLVLFSGEEPHIRWQEYAECIFGLAADFGVEEFIFVGSVASPIPHTREPRVRASVSREDLKPVLRQAGVEFTDYEGPSSLVTMLTQWSARRGIRMSSLVVEVPHYPFLEMPAYPRSILKTLSVLSQLLRLDLDLSDLRASADAAQDRLNEIMGENDQFEALVRRLEEAYDAEESTEDEDLLRRLIDGMDLGGDGDRI